MVDDCIIRFDTAYFPNLVEDLFTPVVVVGVLLGRVDDGTGFTETLFFSVLVPWRARLEPQFVSKVFGGVCALDGPIGSHTRTESPKIPHDLTEGRQRGGDDAEVHDDLNPGLQGDQVPRRVLGDDDESEMVDLRSRDQRQDEPRAEQHAGKDLFVAGG